MKLKALGHHVRSVPSLSAIVFSLATGPASTQSFDGAFEFRWTSEPSNHHRVMETLSEISFVDRSGTKWSVPPGTPIDGASIPPVLWSFAGSPFVGNYRRASVVHDHYCDIKTMVASKIHKMFLEAMEADGVGTWERRAKYAAVSAYSIAGGRCGIKEDTLAQWSGHPRLEGMISSEELLANLERFQTQSDLGTVEQRSQFIGDVARVDKSRTFAALTAFRRVPSQENYEELSSAIQIEQPAEDELENLILLSKATVPEGSIAVSPR